MIISVLFEQCNYAILQLFCLGAEELITTDVENKDEAILTQDPAKRQTMCVQENMLEMNAKILFSTSIEEEDDICNSNSENENENENENTAMDKGKLNFINIHFHYFPR